MEMVDKKNILNILYGVALIFALLGLMQLMINAINLLAFKISGYTDEVYTYASYTSVLCLIAAIISFVGLGLFISSFFIKKNKGFHIALIVIEGVVIIGLLVLSIIAGINIPQSSTGYVWANSFNIYASTQAMYLQQLILFAALLSIYLLQSFFEKKAETLLND